MSLGPDGKTPTTALVVVWAVACAAIALALRWAIDPFVGNALPYIAALCGIAVASWAAGWRAGLLNAILSQLAVTYFFIPPRGSFVMDQGVLVGTIAYYVASGLLIYPTEAARRAIRERDAALQQLRTVSGNKSHFLALLAHELRGPVHTAKLALQVADRDETTAKQRQDSHAVILRQVSHVERLCEELMDTARIEQEKIVLNMQPIAMGELLRMAVERSTPNFDKRQQQIRVSCATPETLLNVDSLRMVQAVSNLMDNASKYSPAGTLTNVEASCAGKTCVLRVVDAGRGFEPGQSDKLFETFFQVAPGSEGLGLGLPLVRKLVELHGGTVSASSEGVGMGATFEIRLPSAVQQ